MARETSTTKAPKKPNRFRQMWDVFQMTRKYDKRAIWYLLVAFVVPVILGIVLAFVLAATNVLGFVLYVILGVVSGLLASLVVLGRRAERAAYSQIEGQPGAVGAVLKNSIRGSWQTSEMPVNVSPRTQDAVYRAVGRGGVVLIGEGPRSRTQKMLDEERRTVARILPNVPVTFLYVGPDSDAVPLYKLAGRMRRIKGSLNKSEVFAVSNRLASLAKSPVGIPKGMDPNRARAPRPR
ncbi:DUF4191 domain-containing protein [Galbitalea soli]|uniref:DUF4191 domain-containing protein n=1 Tax=Galbitalea soli TaxID=1268042 RepID=A0A7C9TQ02_9MICO|nr:DUF4191 domain-containing protein [Galbitalea soli]NEM90284.1 DUF4191 domain-containing protein [Galbitalea soli]NYJ30992.1 putative membrane protein YeaQ/YmgE (transglycosylase-associated protein family) [Galbitalea soli]